MENPIENKINNWDRLGDGNKYSELNLKILHLTGHLFCNYEPTLGPELKFEDRLNNWLENTAIEDEQKILFELVPHLFYLGEEEFRVLYREAYNTVFARWLLDDLKISLTDVKQKDLINKAISETWFCPISDSFRINLFYHVNNIPSKQDYRPDWRSLVKFGSEEKIKDYIIKNEIKRIVLLEDFVGNGGQVSDAVVFAASFLDIPILIIPLLICPAGVKNSKSAMEKYKNLIITPVLSLPESFFITPEFMEGEKSLYTHLRRFMIDNYLKVSGGIEAKKDTDPYGPFGWRETGGLVVMFSNTPNNTIPIVHNESHSWKPLFKRHKRI